MSHANPAFRLHCERVWADVVQTVARKTRFRRLVRADERVAATALGLHVVAFSCLLLQQALALLAEPST